MVSQGSVTDGSDDQDARLTRRQRDLIASGGAMGGNCLYVPGEILVASGQEERLRDVLEDNGVVRGVRIRRSGRNLDDFDFAAAGNGDEFDPIVGETLDERLGVVRYSTRDPGRDVVELVRAVQRNSDRDPRDDDGPAAVALNHVLSGEPVYMGGPGGEPSPAPEFRFAEAQAVQERILAVLDTGIAVGLEDVHAELFALLSRDNDNVDLLDSDRDGRLDAEAGHGTFIAGLIRRVAPHVGIRMKRVLNPYGFGDDLSVSTGLLDAGTPVLNLSLGGYTLDDRPPPALAGVLHQLGREVVVVAAAGNNHSDRPFWPAAFKQVVAVAALDTTGDTPTSTDFSNHGDWVSVCAPGTSLHSSYVRGGRPDGPTFAGWACWSGTSFAAPLVAAAIAARVAGGVPPRQAVADLLAGLPLLPGLERYGPYYDPQTDLLVPR